MGDQSEYMFHPSGIHDPAFGIGYASTTNHLEVDLVGGLSSKNKELVIYLNSITFIIWSK
jgi:hypothetical protein